MFQLPDGREQKQLYTAESALGCPFHRVFFQQMDYVSDCHWPTILSESVTCQKQSCQDNKELEKLRMSMTLSHDNLHQPQGVVFRTVTLATGEPSGKRIPG